jgi:GT2 family glycosyltransferase/glycosyltransferase involved in cell wall biosynthesis
MRVLVIVHAFPPLAQGGAEYYAHALATRLHRDHHDDVAVLTREHVIEAPEYRTRDERRDGLRIRWVNNTFRGTRSFAESYDNPRITALAAEYIDEVRPDVAHVHHLTCLSTGIAFELKRRGVPVVLTLHDYWLLCHRGQLLDVNLERCDGPLPDGCAKCLGRATEGGAAIYAGARAVRALESHLPVGVTRSVRQAAEKVASTLAGTAQDAPRARLAHMRQVVDCVDRTLAPSRHMRDRFLPLISPGRIEVSEYGVDLERFSVRDPRIDRSSDLAVFDQDRRPLRLGFLGSLMVSKAPHLLIEAHQRLPSGSATVTLVGAHTPYHADDSYRARLEPLLRLPGVTCSGPLPPDEVPQLLASFDLLVVPSIWEENSPLVIREAFAAGVPVVASRIGGIPEMVEEGAGGVLFEPGDVDDLTRVLRHLTDDPTLISHLKARIPVLRGLDDDARMTRGLYARLVDAAAKRSGCPTDAPTHTRARVAAVVLNFQTPDETLLAVRSIAASIRPFDDIIVVDNGSDETCRVALADVRDRISMVQTGSNLGFSGGVNAGIREAQRRQASHVMLINSDVILAPSALGTLLEALEAHPSAGIVAPLVLSRTMPDTIATAGMSFSELTGRMRHAEAGQSFQNTAGRPWEEVSGVSGCAMLVADAVFHRIGLFPEQYFFSFEDLAFCLAARDAGIGTGICRTAVAYHEGSRSLGPRSVRRLYFATRNHLHLAAGRPAMGPVHALLRSAAIVTYNALYALHAPGATPLARLRAVARGVRHHAARRYGSDLEP